MRFRIAAQLGVVLVLLGFLAAGTTGGFVYSISRDLLIRSAKEKLLTLTQDLSRRMVASRQDVIYDLQILSEHPDTLALLAQRTPPQDAEKRLTGLFSQIMDAHPAYHRIQLISARDFGLEQIRVERRHLRIASTRPEELQEKGHYAYVSEALKQPPRAAYMSRITARPEPALDAEDRPTTQLSMPVYFSGHAFARGIIVITLDIQHEFSRLSENTPHGLDLFLANGHGDILIHPDASRTFGFDQGRRAMIQTEFPPVSALLDGRQQQVLFDTDATVKGTGGSEARVAAFVRQGIEIASGDNWLYVGLSQPLATVLEDARQLEQSILRSLALVLPACLIIAILLARIVCRPINRLREAVQRFTKGESLGGLPIRRQDELGDLARSFKQMQDTITEQLGALQQNKNELEELIRHDPLTGLPNRRMLNERLDHAIALTQRGHYGVALLFIDLDGFKDINDTLGHDAGDIVLVSVARRLLEKVRVTDTVARLGGDEFVVLLVGAPHHEAIASIAASVVTSIGEPIPVRERSLAVRASIGIALFPDDGKTASELLVAADHAMYRVKRGGRPGYTFANDNAPLRFE